jgi:hypothetical protein
LSIILLLKKNRIEALSQLLLPYLNVPLTCGTGKPHVVDDRPVKDIQISNFKPCKPKELLQDYNPTLTWSMKEGFHCPFFSPFFSIFFLKPVIVNAA